MRKRDARNVATQEFANLLTALSPAQIGYQQVVGTTRKVGLHIANMGFVHVGHAMFIERLRHVRFAQNS